MLCSEIGEGEWLFIETGQQAVIIEFQMPPDFIRFMAILFYFILLPQKMPAHPYLHAYHFHFQLWQGLLGHGVVGYIFFHSRLEIKG